MGPRESGRGVDGGRPETRTWEACQGTTDGQWSVTQPRVRVSRPLGPRVRETQSFIKRLEVKRKDEDAVRGVSFPPVGPSRDPDPVHRESRGDSHTERTGVCHLFCV